jgi:L-amino acid N-acyltransferase YncA
MRTSDAAAVRAVTVDDAAAIARIYNYYVTDTIVTFEEEPVSADDMVARIRDVESASLPWFVAEENGNVVGYAYAGKWKARHGYRIAVEVTVYLDAAHGGRGVGSALYSKLLTELKSIGIHTALGGIALPNDASIRLHEKFGFTKVAHFKENGIKFGKLIDVAYWQLMF